jgi:hypothetical protein
VRTYPIKELTLPTKYDDLTAKFQVVLARTIYILAEDHFGIARGAVLIWNKRMGIYQIWSGGLFDAIRATSHMQAGYGLTDGRFEEFGEINQLTLGRASLAMLLRQIWNYGNLSDTQRAEYAEGCLALAEELQLVRDEGKVIARDRIGQAASVISSLGHYNPPSRSPLLWSSADLLKYRQEAIRLIARWVDVRQFALLTMLDEIYGTVQYTYERTRELAEKTAPGSGNILPSGDAVGLVMIGALQRVVVLPFRHGFTRTATDLDSARKLYSRSSLSASEGRTIHLLYDRSERSMVLYMIRRDLEPIIKGLTSELNRRKVNRRTEVIEQAMRELASFVQYIGVYEDFDENFRNRILLRMHRHLEEAVRNYFVNGDLTGVREHLRRATIMF